LISIYFGLPQGKSRVINLEYPALIDAIYRQTDDGIFFSKLLCSDLFEHNRRLAERFKRRFGKGAPAIIDKPDFTKAEAADLMPNDADYADWFTLFVKGAKSADPRRKSILSFLSGRRRGTER
jgi:hypothetical protein